MKTVGSHHYGGAGDMMQHMSENTSHIGTLHSHSKSPYKNSQCKMQVVSDDVSGLVEDLGGGGNHLGGGGGGANPDQGLGIGFEPALSP